MRPRMNPFAGCAINCLMATFLYRCPVTSRCRHGSIAAMAHLTKGNETTPILVPKNEAHAAEALKQRKSAYATKLRMVAKRPRQPVIGNAAA